MPRIAHSGTPSITEPTTMPMAPPAPLDPNRLSIARSATRKTVTPNIIHSDIRHCSMWA
jgi:hypothetical protein